MEKVVVGIAGNEILEHVGYFHGAKVCYTQLNFVSALEKVGALPLVIPITSLDNVESYISKIDKLLLAGGDDVSPLFYGEEPLKKLGKTNPHRDEFELALVVEAIKQNKPILGVCRGLQLINVAFGGSLYQDLSENQDSFVKHLQAPTIEKFTSHTIDVCEGSFLADFLPKVYLVNSYHHQMIKKLGNGLTVAATAKDGVIEAVECASKKVIAVQWHPEMNWEYDEFELKIFDYFVKKV